MLGRHTKKRVLCVLSLGVFACGCFFYIAAKPVGDTTLLSLRSTLSSFFSDTPTTPQTTDEQRVDRPSPEQVLDPLSTAKAKQTMQTLLEREQALSAMDTKAQEDIQALYDMTGGSEEDFRAKYGKVLSK